MRVDTKYNIGDRIWVVYEQMLWTESYKGPSGEVTAYSTKITDILVPESGKIDYGTDTEGGDSILEEDIILYSDLDLLAKRIKDLDDKIRKREENEK